MNRTAGRIRRLVAVSIAGILGGVLLSVGTGLTVGGVGPFQLLVSEILTNPSVLRTRWNKVPILSPSAQNWSNLAGQVVEDYVGTDPPMFRGDEEILVELPSDWPGDLTFGR